MMKRGFLRVSLVLLTFCFFISPSLTANRSVQKAELEGFSEFVEKTMKECEVPGVAICIVKDGEVIFSEGFGYRDVKRGLKFTPRTISSIGSTAKAFTATCVGILVDEGKVDWDKPVREYLPSFKLKDPFASERITPRDLLCHRCGLPRHDPMWKSTSGNNPTRKEILERLRYLEPSTDFRTTYQYQNQMFLVASELVGEVTGTSWDEFIKERIFDPLGMKDTNISLEETQRSSDYALPYHRMEGEVRQVPFQSYENCAGADSINSTIVDMAKWILLNLNKGKYGKKQIISEASLKEMHSPQMIMTGSRSISDELFYSSYGLGWWITAYRGQLMLWHTGGARGLNNLVSLMPRDNIGLVIQTNMHGTPLRQIIMYNVYDRLLGLDQIPWNKRFREKQEEAGRKAKKAKEEKDKDRKLDTKPSHPLEDYTGDFHNPGYGIFSIEREGDHLKAIHSSGSFILTHYHYDIFELRNWRGVIKSVTPLRNPIIVSFFTDARGNIQSLSIPWQRGVEEIVFTRVEARTEDRGENFDDIEEEGRMISHEPWRVSTKNGLYSGPKVCPATVKADLAAERTSAESGGCADPKLLRRELS